MSITEIQIGNWVYDEEGISRQIVEVGENLQVVDFAGNVKNINHYNPIKLTESILDYLGFIVKPIGQLYSLGYCLKNDVFHKKIKHDGTNVYSFRYNPIEFSYLHEFQNIYKEEAGKELEVIMN